VTAAALALVRSLHPERVVEVEGEGQFNDAIRVDDRWVVRVPRHAVGVAALRREVELLRVVRPAVEIPVPWFVEDALDRPVGEAYLTHERLPGEVLRRATVDGRSDERVDEIGRAVGTFLAELHAVEVSGLEVRRRSLGELGRELARDVDSLLGGVLPASALASLHDDLRGMLDLPPEPAVLCHTDLGGNLVVDEATGSVGVIDFGDCVVSHPALDVASLSVLGPRLLDAAASVHPLLTSLEAEAEVVRRTFRCQDAVHAARQADWAYVRSLFAG
jgi:aminoglycoside phosphotransferase (APT) family kinase protein